MVFSKHWILAATLCAHTLAAPALASERPITLLGINLGMNREEIIGVLAEQGFSCSGASEMVCKAQKTLVRVASDQLIFSCGTFNFCDQDIRDIARALVKDGIVPKMERQFDTIEPFGDLGNYVHVMQYCGTGPGGDIVCVQMDIVTDPFIFIKRGSLGRGGMNFRGQEPLT